MGGGGGQRGGAKGGGGAANNTGPRQGNRNYGGLQSVSLFSTACGLSWLKERSQ